MTPVKLTTLDAEISALLAAGCCSICLQPIPEGPRIVTECLQDGTFGPPYSHVECWERHVAKLRGR